MSWIRPILVVAVVAASLCGERAAAFPVCEEEISFDLAASHVVDPSAVTAPAPEPAPPPAAALPIVPCAMVESGVLGAECADVAFYVVTQAGVLLCSVDLDTLAVQHSTTPAVEPAPAAPAGQIAFGLVAHALAPDGVRVPMGSVVELAPASFDFAARALDRGERPPVPPS